MRNLLHSIKLPFNASKSMVWPSAKLFLSTNKSPVVSSTLMKLLQIKPAVLLLLMLAGSFSLAQTPPRLGVNTTTPQHTLDVNGEVNVAADKAYHIAGTPVLRTQQVVYFGSTYTTLYLGPGAGESNTTGLANHFIGSQAGFNNTTGSYNHFSGYQASYSNTSGSFNHFSGYQAGYSNTTGYTNQFSGYQAGYSNTTGYTNHFSGNRAGFNNTTGFNNHFSGYQAGFKNTEGNSNHFSGFQAGYSNTTGSQNVYIGYRAGSSSNYTNAIAIGYNVAARADNTVTIGNAAMTSIGGYQAWSNLSDARFKREVAEDVPGLSFVTRLRPVSYHIDRSALQRFLQGEEASETQAASESKDIPVRETGFIAQEVEAAAQAIGYDFNGIIAPQSERDHYQLSYATFVVPLVRAVQEQQEQIKALQAKVVQQEQIKALQAEVARLKTENARMSSENKAQRTELDHLRQLEGRLEALEGLLHLQTSTAKP